MNNFTPTLKSLMIGCLLCLSFVAKAQNPTYELHITNETQPNDSTYQFDVYLLRTGATDFELASFQFGLGYDTSITNGGKISFKIVSGSSQLGVNQVPSSVTAGTVASTTNGITYKYLNLAAKSGPGAGNGTIISDVKTACTSPGTRVATFQVLDSGAKFRSGSTAKFIFSTAVGSGKSNTIVQAYVSSINTTITSAASNLGYGSTGTCYQNISLNTCNLTVTKTSQTNVTCFGGSNGSATVTLSGGYGLASTGTYKLDNPNRTDSIAFTSNPFTVSGLSAGAHTIYVRSSAGSCTANTGSFTITAPSSKDSASYSVSGCGSYSLPWGGTVSTGGNYSHTYSSVNGCDSIITYIVSISTPPTLGTLSGTQAICSNGTTTFSSTASGGSWTSGNSSVATINSSTGVVTPVSSGTATMTYRVTGSGVCADSTGTRTVTITAPPVSGTLSGTQAICSSSSTTFSSTSSGGTWSSSNTAVATINSSTGLVTPVSAGTSTMTYTVTGTGGCSNATATRILNVSSTATSSTTVQSACGAYIWNGSTYTSSGTFTKTLTNVGGCDSIATLVLTFSGSAPTTPSSLTQTLVENTCGARIYRYSVPASSNALGFAWSLPQSVGGISGVTLDSGDIDNSRVIRVKYNSNAAAGSNDSIRVRALSACGLSLWKYFKLSNTLLSTPTTPASITISPVLTNVCSGKQYRFTAPSLPTATSSVAAVNERIWSFTGSLGSNAVIIDSSADNMQWILVSFTSNDAATTGDSVKLRYSSDCGYSVAKALKLTNVQTKLPTAPASLTAASVLTNVCTGKIYRYTAPALPTATTATATVAAVSGRLWSFTGLGTTGTITTGDEGSTVIEVTYPTNDAAGAGDSVKLQHISVCGYSPAKALKLTNLTTKLPTAPASVTASAVLTNVCSGKIYRYKAPTLPAATTATATVATVTGRLWSFTGLGTTGTITTGDEGSMEIQVTYPTNDVAGAGDSVKLLYTSACGYSPAKAIKLTNLLTKLPPAPASITAASVLTNVCSGKIYRYTAPALPSAASATGTVASVTGRLWSFSGLGETGTISTGDEGSTIIEVTYPTNDAAVSGDSVKLQHVTACGYTLTKALKLTNKAATIPTPASITASVVSDVCGARRYRYTAPTLATTLASPSVTGTVQAVNGYQWVLPTGPVGSTGTLANGFELTSNPIEVIYTSNDAAPLSGDSVKVSYTTSSCGNGSTKGLKLTNTKKTCSSVPFSRVSQPIKSSESIGVKVYPNPTTSNFNMQIVSADKSLIDVKVTDVQGRLIKILQVSANQITNIGSDLKPGTYIIEAIQGKQTKTTRLLKF